MYPQLITFTLYILLLSFSQNTYCLDNQETALPPKRKITVTIYNGHH